MHSLLAPEGGSRHLLLGNEAIARGALEAGVAVATTYPGTPSTEIGDTFFRLSPHTDRYYFEFSTNEKVALEVAAGAAIAGVRSLCFMKHVGMNVASDPMMTLAYLGVNAGLVVVTADEPGCHSSQNEQDNRLYARLANLPLLEPATPDEARQLTRFGLELSERLQLPVILRTTTRVSHMRGVVTFDPLPAQVRRRGHFQREPARFSYNPAVAKRRRTWLLGQLDQAETQADADEARNPIFGQGPLAVLVSGVSWNYLRDALVELDLVDRVRVGKLGFSYPLSGAWLQRFLQGVTRCLVLEEVEPLLERAIRVAAQENDLHLDVLGRTTGHLSRAGELSLTAVTAAVAALAEREVPSTSVAKDVGQGPSALPGRPPTLCPGCAHRNTFYAAKLATGDEAHYHLDIGCYTLGQLPPLELCDLLICMGSGVNTGAGFARVLDKPSIAFVGDSTFFHSGLPGLMNAVHNRHREVLVVMDNRTTAMTGHQPHPGTPLDGMMQAAPEISIEALVRATGVDFVQTVDPTNLRRTMEVFQAAVAHPRVAVIVSRAACRFVERPKSDAPTYVVDADRCCYCGLHGDHAGCGEVLHRDTQLARASRRIRTIHVDAEPKWRRLPDKPAVAPCSDTCPARVCVQSYASLIAAGRYVDAARAVRERLPLPGTVARVCHRPCEQSCTRSAHEGAVAINALKRFATDHEDHAAVARELAARVADAPDRGSRVAVIGAGPAGLTAAHDLRLRGHAVTILEAAAVAGGLLALGIPAYRLDRVVLRREIELILSLGVELRAGCRVGRDPAWSDLIQEFDAVVVAAGAWRSTRLAVPGEDAQGVYEALAYLAAANQGAALDTGAQVVVVGGGDAAVDAARVARRLGPRSVTLAYRRTRQEMPAHVEEVEAAEDEGVRLRTQVAPVAVVTDEAGRVRAIRLVGTEPGPPDASGRRRPVPVEGTEFELPCDTIITAVGQGPSLDWLPDAVERTQWGTLRVEADTGATTLPNVFAAGDAVTGSKTVIHAIAGAQRAAYGVDAYLSQGRWEAVPVDRLSPVPPSTPSAERYQPVDLEDAPRQAMPTTPAATRVPSFDEVELGFTEAQARKEADRCLVCGQCAKCRVCVDTFGCPAIVVQDGRVQIDELLCIGCGVCAQLCPNNAIHPLEQRS